VVILYLCLYFNENIMSQKYNFLIITNTHTARLQYVVQLIFEELLGLKTLIITDENIGIAQGLPCLYYGNNIEYLTTKKPVLWQSSALLFEIEITPQPICVDTVSVAHLPNLAYLNEVPALFAHSEKRGILKFDILAAVFYSLTRYEEYLPHKADAHGRFLAKKSWANTHQCLHLPVVEVWVALLRDALQTAYPSLVFRQSKYHFQPTFDIDMAWAYRHKNVFQTIGRVGIDFLRGNWSALRQRFLVVTHQANDPFFTFDYIEKTTAHLSPIFFFLLGEYGKYDKNTSPQNAEFQNLILRLSQKYRVGIHPSYASNNSFSRFEKELKMLSQIINKNIKNSRQHFLKLHLPDTYRRLYQCGIRTDYTMGYAEQLGFRAGISQSFYWFDLETNCVTDLRVVPFCAMDVTLRVYLGLSPELAIVALSDLVRNVRAVNGELVAIWHNNSLSDEAEWEGWRDVYEHLLSDEDDGLLLLV
jgi:hypothetical protein